jgi:translocation and assembly module TamA
VLLLVLLAAPVWAAKPEIELNGGTKSLRANILLHLTLANESCKTPRWRLNALLADMDDEAITNLNTTLN